MPGADPARRAHPPGGAPREPLHRAPHPGARIPAPPTPDTPRPRTAPSGAPPPSRLARPARQNHPVRFHSHRHPCRSAPKSRPPPPPTPHCSRVAAGTSAPGLAGQWGPQAPHRLHSPATPHRSRKHRRSAMVAARPCAATAGVGAAAGAAGLPAPRALPTGCQLRHLCTSAPPRPRSAGETRHFRPRPSPAAPASSAGRVGLPWQPGAACGARRAAPDRLRRGTPGSAALGVKGRCSLSRAAPASVPAVTSGSSGFVHRGGAGPRPQAATRWSRPCCRGDRAPHSPARPPVRPGI